MNQFRATIVYIAKDKTEHTLQATFSSLPLGLTRIKVICGKEDIERVKKILVEEI